MKQQDIRVQGIYLTLVSEEEVAVVVTGVIAPDGNWNKKTRYAVKRADNGQPLPKFRTAAAFRGLVTALPMEKSAGLPMIERLGLSDAWHTQKRPAPKVENTMAHYSALLAKAGEIGWPLRFRTDLTEHDRNKLATTPCDRPFSWILREDGTSIYFPGVIDRTGKRASDGARMNAKVSGDEKCKFFIWDGHSLAQYNTAEEADDAMREIENKIDDALRAG